MQPLVGGIYTSDPEKLSLKATLPRFLDMERDFGSVTRATLAEKKQASRRPRAATSGQPNAGERPVGGASSAGEKSSGSGARYGLFATPERGLSSLVSALEDNLRQ